METSDFTAVGEIIKAQGIRGELKVIPLTDDPKRFGRIRRVFFRRAEEWRELYIQGYRMLKEFVLIKFDGINDLTAAEDLGRGLIYIPREERPVPPEGRYYHDQILGLKVSTVTGEFLGAVDQIFQTGANDVYSVKLKARQILIPALKSVVRRIDLEKGEMLVELPAGLVEDM
jgi:16S rRNA processing protein RimM